MRLLEREQKYFLHTYKRIPLDIERGEGVFLIDKNGRRYMDFFAGLAVNALGYAHEGIVHAVTKQIGLFAHLSNNYITEVQTEFAELLLKYSSMDKVFLTNSGTEACEAAMKLIRLLKGPDKTIYSLTNDFHGRTYGALSLTQRDKYQKGFEPLLANTGAIRFNDIDDLRAKVNENTAAVILEFIQGEGGINEVSLEFTRELETLRERFGIMIVADGIQCGIGRTGAPYYHSHFGFKPDCILAAKAVGGGLPLGALLVAPEYENAFPVGKHGTTFGGNPVSCAAGVVVLREVFERGLMQKVAQLGAEFKDGLERIARRFPEAIRSVRGKGFMLGVEMRGPGAPVVEYLFQNNILSNCTNDTVIRILPPLIAERGHIEEYLTRFEEAVERFTPAG